MAAASPVPGVPIPRGDHANRPPGTRAARAPGTPLPPSRLAVRTASWCGIATASIGAVVVAAWHLDLESLVRISADRIEIRYVTALMLLCCGAALFGAAREHRGWPVVLAALAAASGALTLAEYLFEVDLAIDHLGPQRVQFMDWPHPGRMAPNTALAFLLAGTAILLAGRGTGGRAARIAGAGGGIAVAALAAASLLGYALRISSESAVGALLPMAIQTALGFSLLGVGLWVWAAARAGPAPRGASPWIPLGIALGGMAFTWLLWVALTQKEDRTVAAQLDADARVVHVEISESVAAPIAEIAHQAEVLAATPNMTHSEWVASARRFAYGHGERNTLAWFVPALDRAWVVEPPTGSRLLDLQVTGTDARSLLPDPDGVGVALRIVLPLPGPGGVPGRLVALIAVDELLTSQLTSHGLSDDIVRIYDHGREAFRFGRGVPDDHPDGLRTVLVDAPPTSLSATVEPDGGASGRAAVGRAVAGPARRDHDVLAAGGGCPPRRACPGA